VERAIQRGVSLLSTICRKTVAELAPSLNTSSFTPDQLEEALLVVYERRNIFRTEQQQTQATERPSTSSVKK
jgi:hypothetical protein